MPLKSQKGTRRESSKKHFQEEKKTMEHELCDNETIIRKVENDKYELKSDSIVKGRHVVEFLHPDTGKEKKVIFEFEENYNKLKHLWPS